MGLSAEFIHAVQQLTVLFHVTECAVNLRQQSSATLQILDRQSSKHPEGGEGLGDGGAFDRSGRFLKFKIHDLGELVVGGGEAVVSADDQQRMTREGGGVTDEVPFRAMAERLVGELIGGLTPQNHPLALKLAALPDEIRGYGHIKDANIEKARRKEAELLAQWRNPAALKAAAE